MENELMKASKFVNLGLLFIILMYLQNSPSNLNRNAYNIYCEELIF